MDILLLISLICAFIQFYYIWKVFFGLYNFNEHSTKLLPSTSTVSVSVIIAARNEYKNLIKLIPVLMNQKVENQFEVIVANDRSEDSSLLFLEKMALKFSNFAYVNIKETPKNSAPKKYALQQAILKAKNPILLLTDADCLPLSTQWIERMTKPFSNPKTQIVLGFSQYQKLNGFLNRFIRYETFQTGMKYLSFAIELQPFMGVGRNLAYRKSLFEHQHGFGKNESVLSGDDDLFVNAASNKENTTIVVHPDSQTISMPKTTFKDWYQQKIRHLSVGRKYKITDQIRLSLYMFSLFVLNITFVCSFFLDEKETWKIHGIVIVYLLRVLSLGLVMRMNAQKLGENNLDWEHLIFLPIFDVLYMMYWWGVGIASLNARTITWKT
jgi:glycosyltransferase involved in cell wall biosynthesis